MSQTSALLPIGQTTVLKNTDGLFPVSIRQQYNLYGEYKNTVQEFFATATLSYRHVHYNTLNEQSISENRIVHTLRLHSNSTQSWFLLSTLSKGFFDWNLKTSLDLQLSRNTGWQLTQFQIQTPSLHKRKQPETARLKNTVMTILRWNPN